MEPEEARCHGERRSLCFLNCQAAPVDYSWLQPREKLISAVRSRRGSSDPAQGDTNRHEFCAAESAGDVWLESQGAFEKGTIRIHLHKRCLMSAEQNIVCGGEVFNANSKLK